MAGAGGEGRLTPGAGLALFGFALAATLLVAWLNDFVALFRQVPQDLSPRELTVRARGHLESFGYEPHADFTAHGVTTDEPALRRLRTHHPWALDPAFLRAGLPAVTEFWYRQSRTPLAQRLAANDNSGWSLPGRVLPSEPPLRDPGMTCLFLDLAGRLVEFHAVPDPAAPALPPDKEIDPKVLLAAAGFADGSLRETKARRRTPPVFADRRLAWEGEYPNLPGVPVRVEAAFFRGRPVYFHVGVAAREGEADHGDRLPGFMPESVTERIQEQKNMIVGLIALPLGGWFAWVNWRNGRANPFGATVLAVAFVASGLVVWLLVAKHVPNAADELSMFTAAAGRALFDGLLLWLAYLALEPWVRQNSPRRLISWSRLMEGNWRDPLVGRDVLTGVAVGAGFGLLVVVLRAAPRWLGSAPDLKLFWDAAFVEGPGDLLLVLQVGVLIALRLFFLFFLIVLACGRWAWLAAVLNVAVWASLYQHGGGYLPVAVAVGLAYAAAGFFVLYRAGLLGYIAFTLVEQVQNYLPTTVDFSAWYAGISTQSLLTIIGLAAYGTWAACRRR